MFIAAGLGGLFWATRLLFEQLNGAPFSWWHAVFWCTALANLVGGVPAFHRTWRWPLWVVAFASAALSLQAVVGIGLWAVEFGWARLLRTLHPRTWHKPMEGEVILYLGFTLLFLVSLGLSAAALRRRLRVRELDDTT